MKRFGTRSGLKTVAALARVRTDAGKARVLANAATMKMGFETASTRGRRRRSRPRHSAFTMIEVVISTLLVGTVLVAAMNNMGAATRGQLDNRERSQASLLAGQLMEEITALPYGDPEGGTGLGTDTGESSTTRADFDDVDDYAGWIKTPPQDKQGNALTSGTGLSRTVTVDYMDPSNLANTSQTDQGVKRIVVVAKTKTETLAELTALVADGK